MSIVKGIKGIPEEYRMLKGLRPLVTSIVLYAHSNEKVKKYSEEITLQLLKNGIDVCVREEYQAGIEIKVEHISNMVSSSHGDFVITIGDRNLKNQSIQVRRRGSLVEASLSTFIFEIWTEMKSNSKNDIFVRSSDEINEALIVKYIEKISLRNLRKPLDHIDLCKPFLVISLDSDSVRSLGGAGFTRTSNAV